MFKKIFLIVDTCLSCEDTARQSCAMVPKWRYFASCISASRVQYISDMRSKFALRPHHMCGSMVDIQTPTAEIRRGKKRKKEERRKKPHGKNIMVCTIA